ncbi:MAG: hypothetical protein ACI8O8_003038 [Oleiphilaceae bacterium]|jgi:hypothetical protein
MAAIRQTDQITILIKLCFSYKIQKVGVNDRLIIISNNYNLLLLFEIGKVTTSFIINKKRCSYRTPFYKIIKSHITVLI